MAGDLRWRPYVHAMSSAVIHTAMSNSHGYASGVGAARNKTTMSGMITAPSERPR